MNTPESIKLSIVIVNYNVKHFLEQCLLSVRKAMVGLDVEVFVVDNNSVDSSQTMIREKFPDVHLIANKDNKGFSRANNQAIQKANGKYILLLNPDTVVEDDTFKKIIAFMDEHPDAGGLGVKMIDGKGNFLPESKRGLPRPNVAFYKISGLARLFPKSKTFGKYHLGYLDKDQIHEVDVLSGAFMLLRKSVLDEIGLLDETFFMYGEDIDLSYRITKAGYKNYYFPKTRIIHYKGESTKKSSINYVFVFYNAMVIFAKKHFSKKNAKMFSILINVAIYLRATMAIVSRFLSRAFLPILDILLLYAGIYFIQEYWEKQVIFPDGGHYPVEFITIVVPIYIFIWLISVYFSGGYDRPIRLLKILQGIFIGTMIILVAYALLSESYRFSRAIIILGATWGLISLTGIRLLLHLLKFKIVNISTQKNKRFIIIGGKEEANRVAALLQNTYASASFIGLVNAGEQRSKNDGFIGSINQIKDIIFIYKISEVIFCSKDLSHQVIIDKMSELQDAHVDFKIAPEDSHAIIGSNSINTSGEFYTVDINSIADRRNKRNKRFLDIVTALIILIVSPVMIFLVKKPAGLFRNIVTVFFGKHSWVGYFESAETNNSHLPGTKSGILNPGDAFPKRSISIETASWLNLVYARDYKFTTDINIMFRGIKNLGRTP